MTTLLRVTFNEYPSLSSWTQRRISGKGKRKIDQKDALAESITIYWDLAWQRDV